MWAAYTDLTAGLTTLMARQGKHDQARQRREDSAALAKTRAKWETEKRKLEAELGQLRVQVALLEKDLKDSSMQTDGEGGGYTLTSRFRQTWTSTQKLWTP